MSLKKNYSILEWQHVLKYFFFVNLLTIIKNYVVRNDINYDYYKKLNVKKKTSKLGKLKECEYFMDKIQILSWLTRRCWSISPEIDAKIDLWLKVKLRKCRTCCLMRKFVGLFILKIFFLSWVTLKRLFTTWSKIKQFLSSISFFVSDFFSNPNYYLFYASFHNSNLDFTKLKGTSLCGGAHNTWTVRTHKKGL